MALYELKGTILTIEKGNDLGSKDKISFWDDNHIYKDGEMIGMWTLDEEKKRIKVTLLQKDPKVIEILYKMDPKVQL